MPTPTTGLQIIKTAMRHLGVLATGETPTAEELTDGLQALNDVIETWNLESLAIESSMPVVYTTVPGKNTYTIGVGGDWNGARPVAVDNAYCTVSGVDFPIGLWTLEEWMDQPIKTVQQQIIERMAYVNDYPLGRIILWPTPSLAIPITINHMAILSSVSDAYSTLQLAPGYARALAFGTAVELRSQYGGRDVSAEARATKAIIKRANREGGIARFDSALLGGGRVVPARGY